MSGPKTLYPLSGVVGIPQTPFDERDRIDAESLEKTVEDQISAGVCGLLITVVASEVSKLTIGERLRIVRQVADQVGDRVPIIVGASGEPDVARAVAELAVQVGCAGVLVQAPLEFVHRRVDLRKYLDMVCPPDLPMLMIQDLEWNGPGIPIDIIGELFGEVEAFRCIKIETIPAGPKYSAVLEITGGRLNVSGGWSSSQLIEALDRGVHAMMFGGLNWILVEVVRRYRAGDRANAKELFNRLLPVLSWQGQHIDISNQFLKLLAVRQGIFSNATIRNPSVRFDAAHHRIAAELVEVAMGLHVEVGWQPM